MYRTMQFTRKAFTWSFVFLTSLLAFGQTSNTGAPPLLPSANFGVDSIGESQLNIHIHIPVLTKTGTPLFVYALDSDTSSGPLMHTGGAFTGPTPKGLGMADNAGTFHVLGSIGSTYRAGNNTYTYTWTAPDYTVHTWNNVPTSSGATGNALNLDGSGYTLSYKVGTYTRVYDKGGNEYDFDQVKLVDTNGNTITECNTCGGQPVPGTVMAGFMDSLAQPALAMYTNGQGQSYYYYGPNGTTPVVKVNVSTHFVTSSFSCPNVLEYSNVVWPLVDSVSLPDGTSYQFSYQTDGRLAQITLPTGGWIQYTYPGTNKGVDCSYFYNNAITRTDSSGAVWKFTRGHANPATAGTYATTVTDPSGNLTTFTTYNDGTGIGGFNSDLTDYTTFSNLALVSVVGPLDTTVSCYNGATETSIGATTCTAYHAPSPTQPITQISAYHTLGTKHSEAGIMLDSYGNTTNVYRYDWNNGSSYPLVSHASNTYGTYNGTTCVAIGNFVNDRPCQVYSDNGGNPILANATFSYDSHGNLSTQRSWTGAVSNTWLSSSYVYNPNGTIQQATDVNNAQAIYGYASTGSGGCNGLLPTTVQTPIGTVYYTWDCVGGVKLSAKDANGNSTNLYYTDPNGPGGNVDPFWRVTHATNPSSVTTTFFYGSGSNSYSESVMNFNNGGSTRDDVRYLDSLGRVFADQKERAPGSSTLDTTSYQYDSFGRLSGTSMPCAVGRNIGCPASPATTQTYDPSGRPLVTTDGGGGTVTTVYNTNDKLVTVGPAPAGERTKQKQYEYDGLGRLKSVCEITSSPGSVSCGQTNTNGLNFTTGYLTTYAYDALGRVTSITQNSQTRYSSYDGLNRLTSETNPESGTINYVYDSESSCGPKGAYTSNGDLVQTTDARGLTTCFYYDSLHRLTDVGNSAQSQVNYSKRFRYDNTQGVNGAIPAGVSVNNTMGRLAEAETDFGSTLTDEWFSYDSSGRLTDVYESTPNSGGYYHTTAGYFPNGVTSSLSGLPGYTAYSYTVDGEGRATTAVQGTTTLINGVTFNAAGQPTTIQVGTSNDQDNYTYDAGTGRMTNYTFAVNSVSLSGALTWNPNGTLQMLATTDGFNSSGTQTCKYNDISAAVPGYDDVGRLIRVNCGSLWSQTFSYDQYGNATKPPGSSISWNPGYNLANNQYAASSGATYDLSGNLLYDTFNTYTWDVYGKMATVTSGKGTVTCGSTGFCITYDAFGRPVERNYSGTSIKEILYSPLGKTAVMSGQTVLNAYIPLPGVSSMYTTGTGGSNHYMEHHDWRGSVVLSTTLAGRSMDYDRAFAPFGELYNNVGVSTKLNFTGDTQDIFSASPGLYDTPNRELHTTQGRWLSPDPIRPITLENPQVFNKYSYVSNNPLSLIDPSGLFMLTCAATNTCATDEEEGLPLGYFTEAFISDNSNLVFDGRNWSACQTEFCKYQRTVFGGPFGTPGSVVSGWRGSLWALTVLQNPVMSEEIMVGSAIDDPVGNSLFQVGAGAAELGLVKAASNGLTGSATVGNFIRSELNEALDTAVERFEQQGFTPKQQARLATSPELEAAFRGERIDTFFKEEVASNPALKDLQITPRFKFGPDVYDPVSGVWYDVTTPGQWIRHVDRYTGTFGQGFPLYY